MTYTRVQPRIDESGNVVCPRKKDYMAGLFEVITRAIPGRYFAIYYTGMSQIETGNWAVASDDADDEVATIGLADIFQVAKDVGF